jgi:mutator protein MutT
MTDAPIPIAIAVVQWQDRFLIGQRPDGSPLAGLWEFPGGKVHPVEAPEQAAVRECREETGIEVRVERPLLSLEHRYQHGHLQLNFFACSPIDPHVRLPASHRWVLGSELGAYRFPEANRALLELLRTEC